MDALIAPRRSVHQPSRQPRPPAEIPLAEYAVALSIDLPQLVLYSNVVKDLQRWMEQSKAVLAQEEEEAAKMTPELFTEYIRADEEAQAELLVSYLPLDSVSEKLTNSVPTASTESDQNECQGAGQVRVV